MKQIVNKCFNKCATYKVNEVKTKKWLKRDSIGRATDSLEYLESLVKNSCWGISQCAAQESPMLLRTTVQEGVEAAANSGTLQSGNSTAEGKYTSSVSVSRLKTTCSRCRYESCSFFRQISCFPFVSQEIESETAKLSSSSRPLSSVFLIPSPVMSNCIRFRARFWNLAVGTVGFGDASSSFALLKWSVTNCTKISHTFCNIIRKVRQFAGVFV